LHSSDLNSLRLLKERIQDDIGCAMQGSHEQVPSALMRSRSTSSWSFLLAESAAEASQSKLETLAAVSSHVEYALPTLSVSDAWAWRDRTRSKKSFEEAIKELPHGRWLKDLGDRDHVGVPYFRFLSRLISCRHFCLTTRHPWLHTGLTS
jgi:hypothetical protein